MESKNLFMSRIKSSILLRRLAIGYWLLAISLSITACGFKPVYMQDSASSAQLAAIEIEEIPTRNGQVLRNRLYDLLNPDNIYIDPQYTLKINLKQERREFGIQEDLRVTRYDTTLTADYQLISNEDGSEVLKDKTKIYSSFNRTTSEFSTFVAEEDAGEKAAEQLAQEIKGKLSAFFSR